MLRDAHPVLVEIQRVANPVDLASRLRLRCRYGVVAQQALTVVANHFLDPFPLGGLANAHEIIDVHFHQAAETLSCKLRVVSQFPQDGACDHLESHWCPTPAKGTTHHVDHVVRGYPGCHKVDVLSAEREELESAIEVHLP